MRVSVSTVIGFSWAQWGDPAEGQGYQTVNVMAGLIPPLLLLASSGPGAALSPGAPRPRGARSGRLSFWGLARLAPWRDPLRLGRLGRLAARGALDRGGAERLAVAGAAGVLDGAPPPARPSSCCRAPWPAAGTGSARGGSRSW